MRSVLMLALGAALAGCGARRAPTRPPPALIYRGGALAITGGIPAQGPIALPTAFAPDLHYAPRWLEGGKIVALAGNANGKSILLGVADAAAQSVIAQDGGAGAPHGALLDLAVSPDHDALATLAVNPSARTVQVFLIGAGNPPNGSLITEIPSVTRFGRIRWIDHQTIVVVLAAAQPAAPESGADLYIIKLGPPAETHLLDHVRCAGAEIEIAPNHRSIVSEAAPDAPVSLIDLSSESCRRLRLSGPLQFLQWSPDSSAFLFAARNPASIPGVFRYLTATDAIADVAVASSSAAFASDGAIIAIGSSGLSQRAASAQPDRPVAAQVAITSPGRGEVSINQLGFAITPANLARARFVFSTASDDGVLDATLQGPQGLARELIEYAYRARAAFVLAHVAPDAALALGWSPDGRELAIVEQGREGAALTVISPPR